MAEERRATNLVWHGNAPTAAVRVVVTADYTPPTSTHPGVATGDPIGR